MLTSSDKLPQAVSYLKKNISKVTPQTGTQLVLALENAQNKYMTHRVDQYTQSVQKKLMNMYTLNPNDIMADESDHPAILDAGLVIDWDDLLERTLDKEQFILKYPNSNRAKFIKQNYTYAVHTVFYGVDNTLLFDQSNKKFDPTAKKQYLDVLNDDDTIEDYPSSTLLSDLHGFIDLAAQSNDKLTSKLDAYRQQVAPFSL